jgi:hypothetical protein
MNLPEHSDLRRGELFSAPSENSNLCSMFLLHMEFGGQGNREHFKLLFEFPAKNLRSVFTQNICVFGTLFSFFRQDRVEGLFVLLHPNVELFSKTPGKS